MNFEFNTRDGRLLILNMDETLLYATDQKLEERELDATIDFRFGPYYVYKRPGVDEFLARVSKYFQLALWSSGSDGYVRPIATAIAPECGWRFVWARSRCTTHYDSEWMTYMYQKNLKKVKRLGYELARMLIVDDTPYKVANNYGNAIYISPFEGGSTDRELEHLADYLESIYDHPNYRTFEKRRWRSGR
jgi:RNA polymerase II subunit A small phosphatase-like protein